MTILEAAAGFVWANARTLERRLFAHHFADGDADGVVRAVAAYQNADGGFGNALEPDLRTPASQPVPAEFAMRMLGSVDAMPADIVLPMCDWLAGVATDGGVPFVLPSAQGYPHAPWWTPPPGEPEPHLNPTAALAGLLADVDHPWVEEATAFSWRVIEAMDEPEPHSMLCVVAFLDGVADRERAQAAMTSRIGELIRAVTSLDQGSSEYVHRATDFAAAPDSIARQIFSDAEVEASLDGLAERQDEDGGWPVPWPPPSEAAALEWRGHLTVKALLTLSAYGRLDAIG